MFWNLACVMFVEEDFVVKLTNHILACHKERFKTLMYEESIFIRILNNLLETLSIALRG